MVSKSWLRLGVWLGCFAVVFLGVPLVWGQTITVLSYPTNPVPGRSTVRITWSILGATGPVTHNHVHWGLSEDMVDRQYSTPHARSTPYTAVFTAPTRGGTVYFRVHAIVNGRNIYSDIFSFEVLPPQGGQFMRRVKTPVFIPPGQRFLSTIEVTISCDTPEAVIRYTLDGSDPTESSPIYTMPILIRNTTTIKARAYRVGWLPSTIATATYTQNPEDAFEPDDNVQQVNQYKGNRQYPSWLTHLDEKNPPRAAQPEYKAQSRSIFPADDPDYVKFTLARTSHFVAALWPPLSGSLPQSFQLRRHPEGTTIPLLTDTDPELIVVYSGRENPRRLIALSPISNPQPESGYYFIVNHSSRINEYVLALGALPTEENDIYEPQEGTGASPPQTPYFKIGQGANLVHIRKITSTDTDWAWFQVPARSSVRILCAALPGVRDRRISIATYGPKNTQQVVDGLSLSVRLDPNNVARGRASTTLPGPDAGALPPKYYVKITADTTAIYVLKVVVDPQ